MDKAAVIKCVRTYADIVRREFNVKSIVLFGSYACGTAQNESDIDVAIVVDRLEGEWLTTASRLYRLAGDVDVRIEPVILQTSHDESGFLEHVMKTGEVIYSRAA